MILPKKHNCKQTWRSGQTTRRGWYYWSDMFNDFGSRIVLKAFETVREKSFFTESIRTRMVTDRRRRSK